MVLEPSLSNSTPFTAPKIVLCLIKLSPWILHILTRIQGTRDIAKACLNPYSLPCFEVRNTDSSTSVWALAKQSIYSGHLQFHHLGNPPLFIGCIRMMRFSWKISALYRLFPGSLYIMSGYILPKLLRINFKTKSASILYMMIRH